MERLNISIPSVTMTIEGSPQRRAGKHGVFVLSRWRGLDEFVKMSFCYWVLTGETYLERQRIRKESEIEE